MGFLTDLFNPISAVKDTWSTLASLPGTPEAFGSGVYGGLNGDLSWNPYSQDNSVWDTGAGGTELSQDPNNRKIGRTIGTAVGAAFTGGALGALGEGAGDASSAYSLAGSGNVLGDYAGTTASLGSGAGATSGSLGGASLGTGFGGAGGAAAASDTASGGLQGAAERGAARGAISNAGNTANNGGGFGDILKSGLYGAVGGAGAGGINYGINTFNPGSYATDNANGQQLINKGIQGAGNAALGGQSIGHGFLLGAGQSGVNMGLGSLGGMFSQTPDAGQDENVKQALYGNAGYGGTSSPMPQAAPDYSLPQGGSTVGMEGGGNPLKPFINGSQNPYSLDNGTGTATPGASLGNTGYQPAQTFGSGTGGGTSQGMPTASTLSNLLGLYSAYKQHSANAQLQGNLSSMFGQDSPYAQQMKQTLARTAAASGRRSDVGAQTVALQAALAHGNSQNAPQIAALNNNNTNGMNAGLNNIFQLYQGAGGSQGIQNAAQPYLSQIGNYFRGE